jgi:hypothetical protein
LIFFSECAFTKSARAKVNVGVDLISDALPFGPLVVWRTGAIANVVGYANCLAGNMTRRTTLSPISDEQGFWRHCEVAEVLLRMGIDPHTTHHIREAIREASKKLGSVRTRDKESELGI